MSFGNKNDCPSDALKTVDAPLYKSLSCEELMHLPRPRWRVNKLFPQVGLAVVYGASGSGKTFLNLDMGMAIALGREWLGHKTKQAHVFYMPLEASLGIRSRVEAWKAGNSCGYPSHFHTLTGEQFGINDPLKVQGVIDCVLNEGGRGSVVIVDTLARAMSGLDENGAADMGIAIDEFDRIAKAIEGLVIIVHHTGKEVEKGPRGSYSLRAAVDAQMSVTREPNGARTWKMEKVKEGADGASGAFKLMVHDLYKDEDFGDVATSCTVAPDTDTEAAIKKDKKAYAVKLSDQQIAAYHALRQALENTPSIEDAEPGVAPAGAPAMCWKRALKVAEFGIDPDGAMKKAKKRPQQAASRALGTLIEKKVLLGEPGGLSGKGAVWLPHTG